MSGLVTLGQDAEIDKTFSKLRWSIWRLKLCNGVESSSCIIRSTPGVANAYTSIYMQIFLSRVTWSFGSISIIFPSDKFQNTKFIKILLREAASACQREVRTKHMLRVIHFCTSGPSPWLKSHESTSLVLKYFFFSCIYVFIKITSSTDCEQKSVSKVKRIFTEIYCTQPKRFVEESDGGC